MAIFNLGSAGNIQDLKQVKSYLYKLEEQLKYMFSNLDPEENYNERAKLIFAANAERQAALEVALEGITASYVTKETLSQLALTEDQAALRYVNKNGVISEINASSEQVTIKAEKISLEGTVTANNYFKIKQDGSMEAVNGKFSGELVAATGKFSGQLQAATGTFAGSLSAATGTFAGSLSAATGTFSGNLSAAGGTFSGDISGASGTFSGTVRGGTIAIGGTSAANAPFKVDANGRMTASSGTFSGDISGASGTFTGSLLTQGSGTDASFLLFQSGNMVGGRGATTNQGGILSFTDSITLNGTTIIPAMKLASQGLLFAGNVFTTQATSVTQGDTIYQGKTVTYQKIAADPVYIPDMDDYDFTLIQMAFVNGLLVESRVIPMDDD